MPEGDSVLQLSQRLQWTTGRCVTHTDVRVPRHATESFDGEPVVSAAPHREDCVAAESSTRRWLRD